jgi:hypothetical protein
MSIEYSLRSHASFIWSVADKLRGVYKPYGFGRVILPLVVLRRLDCVLEPTNRLCSSAPSNLVTRSVRHDGLPTERRATAGWPPSDLHFISRRRRPSTKAEAPPYGQACQERCSRGSTSTSTAQPHSSSR